MPAKGVNLDGSAEKMRQIWKVFAPYETSLPNFGDGHHGNIHSTDMSNLQEANSRISHAVFKDRETLTSCLMELKERDFGISVVVSGLLDEVVSICHEVGLPLHTVEHSLGVHGRTDRLADESVLEITTMCGHAMVSPNLVRRMLEEVENGKTSLRAAATELSRMCDCGIFNPFRAEKLLEQMLRTQPD
jgi:hypothetical protein